MLFIKNLPPESTVDLQVTEPSIYFGELSNDHVFVKTKHHGVPLPEGRRQRLRDLRRDAAACRVGSVLRKLLFASASARSKTLLSRRPRPPRAASSSTAASPSASRCIAPFLDLRPRSVPGDRRRPAVLDPGRLHDQRPLSRTRRPPASGVNYIRNSVKVVIDAYHGTTTFYLVDPTRSDRRDARPGVPRPASGRSRRCPRACASACAIPQAIFALQAAMFSTYHMTNPAVFYNKEDQWEVPAHRRRGGPAAARWSRTTRSCGCRARRAPSSSRCCRSRRGRRTTWRPGWWRAATASTTASWSCSSSRSRR